MIRTTVIANVAAVCALTALASPAMASDPTRANIAITVSNPGQILPGQSQAGGTYRLTARVPVACWVRPETTVAVVEGSAGAVVEACNNPGGFTVTASYRPLKTTERVQIVYDNRAMDLAKSGGQMLRQSSIAVIKRVNYRFQNVAIDEPLILSLTIQPI